MKNKLHLDSGHSLSLCTKCFQSLGNNYKYSQHRHECSCSSLHLPHVLVFPLEITSTDKWPLVPVTTNTTHYIILVKVLKLAVHNSHSTKTVRDDFQLKLEGSITKNIITFPRRMALWILKFLPLEWEHGLSFS